MEDNLIKRDRIWAGCSQPPRDVPLDDGLVLLHCVGFFQGWKVRGLLFKKKKSAGSEGKPAPCDGRTRSVVLSLPRRP